MLEFCHSACANRVIMNGPMRNTGHSNFASGLCTDPQEKKIKKLSQNIW